MESRLKIEYNFSSGHSTKLWVGYLILAGIILFSLLTPPFYNETSMGNETNLPLPPLPAADKGGMGKFLGKNISLCVFKNLTGIKCPGCGMTRALLFLGHGNIREAVMMNPNSIIVSLIIISMFANKTSHIFAGREMRLYLTKIEKVTVFVLFMLLMLSTWFYNLTLNPFI